MKKIYDFLPPLSVSQYMYLHSRSLQISKKQTSLHNVLFDRVCTATFDEGLEVYFAQNLDFSVLLAFDSMELQFISLLLV